MTDQVASHLAQIGKPSENKNNADFGLQITKKPEKQSQVKGPKVDADAGAGSEDKNSTDWKQYEE